MPDPLPAPQRAALERVREHYDRHPGPGTWAARSYRRLLARYYNRLIPPSASVLEIGCGSGELLGLLAARDVTGIDPSEAQIEAARRRVPHGRFHRQAGEELDLAGPFDVIVVSDTLNYAADIQRLLTLARGVAGAHTRLILNVTSVLWQPAFALATALGLRARTPESSWLTRHDLRNLLALAGWEPVRMDARLLLPVACAGAERVVNRWLAPWAPVLCASVFTVARVERAVRRERPSVSVVIPARNESGNLAAAVARLPAMGSATELIFVEGHSRDDTWERIRELPAAHPGRTIKILRQPGEGKGDAVRAGFAAASGDLLMILDADLTVPPEDLPKFYEALASGRAEFANGVRLVYPVERGAMRFFNTCGNKLFVAAFSWLLGQPVKDTLCGTKALWREDYARIAAGRSHFGDFDPFGDFDLLFGADRLALRILDIPIRYQERTYGATNIRRWRHGCLLARMVFVAARRLKFV